MPLPTEPVTLSAQEIADLKQQLSVMRHDINNHLSLMMAAVELIKRKPDTADRMWKTLAEQPPKITDNMAHFSRTLEVALGIRKD
jgi:hypothetical protein